MKLFIKNHGVKAIVGLFVFYLLFLLPFGSRNLFQHTVRIFSTPEARELGSEIVVKLDSAKSAVSRRIALATTSH